MAASFSSSFFDIEPLVLDACCEICRYTMDTCSLCGKMLTGDRDIFMYRGDTPFCSEECRCHEIMRDEQASAKDGKRLKKDHLTSKEQQRRGHENPAAAESDRVKLAADVPVAS